MFDFIFETVDWFAIEFPTLFGIVTVFVLLVVYGFVMLFFVPLAIAISMSDAFNTTKRFYRKDLLGPCKTCEHSSFLHNMGCQSLGCYCPRHVEMDNLDRIEHAAKKKRLLFW